MKSTVGLIGCELKDLPLYKIPIFLKAVGVKLTGTFVGIKKTEHVDIFIVQTKDACYGRVGHMGEMVVVMPGDIVGFTMWDSAKAGFHEAEVEEGDLVSLAIHGGSGTDYGDGRFLWDETFTKISHVPPSAVGICGRRYFVDSGASGYDATCTLPPGHPPSGKCSGEVLKPGSSSRSWVDIVASAKYAYSTTGGDLHGRMILLAGSIIDFEDDRGLVSLVEQARAAKKAYDDEYNEHGCWKVGDDGESNSSRWLRASQALAKAMIGESSAS